MEEAEGNSSGSKVIGADKERLYQTRRQLEIQRSPAKENQRSLKSTLTPHFMTRLILD